MSCFIGRKRARLLSFLFSSLILILSHLNGCTSSASESPAKGDECQRILESNPSPSGDFPLQPQIFTAEGSPLEQLGKLIETASQFIAAHPNDTNAFLAGGLVDLANTVFRQFPGDSELMPNEVTLAFALARDLRGNEGKDLVAQWSTLVSDTQVAPKILYSGNGIHNPFTKITLLTEMIIELLKNNQVASTIYGAVYSGQFKKGDPRVFVPHSGRLYYPADIVTPLKTSSREMLRIRMIELINTIISQTPTPNPETEVQVLFLSRKPQDIISLVNRSLRSMNSMRRDKDAAEIMLQFLSGAEESWYVRPDFDRGKRRP